LSVRWLKQDITPVENTWKRAIVAKQKDSEFLAEVAEERAG